MTAKNIKNFLQHLFVRHLLLVLPLFAVRRAVKYRLKNLII